jgi:hypothetical protein
MTTLTSLDISFQDVITALQSDQQARADYKDILVQSTGTYINEMIAGGIVNNQYAIERASQEGFLETAYLDSSIFAIARQLGVHISRKTSGHVDVSLTSVLAGTLPAFTQFTIAGKQFYNRDELVFGAATVLSVTLYQGTVNVFTAISDGSKYQPLVITQASPWTVSDITNLDMLVKVGSDVYTFVPALWTAGSTDKVFYENSTSDGLVEIRFGNGVRGVIPPTGETIQVTYVETQGTAANQANSTTFPVTNNVNPTIAGFTVNNGPYLSWSFIEGADEDSAIDFKYLIPGLYRSNERFVNRDDYRVNLLAYPGVVDAKVVGEAELGPGNPAYQTMVGIHILYTNGLQVLDVMDVGVPNIVRTLILAFVNERGMMMRHVLRPLTNLTVTPDIEVLVDRAHDKNTVKAACEQALQQLFTPKRGIISKPLYVSDIMRPLQKIEGVVIVDVNIPTAKINANYNEYITMAGTPTLVVNYE